MWYRFLLFLAVNGLLFGGGSLRDTCSEVPLVSAAWQQLPPDQRFPCDARHLVIIRSFADFLKAHPEIAGSGALREKARHALAFSTGDWPIYVNLEQHGELFHQFAAGNHWLAPVFAGVLAHERVHAMGNLSESAGLLEELRLDQRFADEGKLPPAFDIPRLRQQYLDALAAEQRPIISDSRYE